MFDRAEIENRPITQMKLLKLVYIAYGWYLSVLDKRLFDEPIYAWKHGPVVRSLYDEFKHNIDAPIHQHSIQFDLDEKKVTTPRILDKDAAANLVLGSVWDIYKHYSASQLRNKTHEAGTPWYQVYDPEKRNALITDALIKPHFDKKIAAYLDAADA